jgi:hypothetical protein
MVPSDGESWVAGRGLLLFEIAKYLSLSGDCWQKSGEMSRDSSQSGQEILQAVFDQPELFQRSFNCCWFVKLPFSVIADFRKQDDRSQQQKFSVRNCSGSCTI